MPVPADLFAPELILVNGVIHTVDQDAPQVSAVAIRDGRFVATGSDEAIRALAGPNTVIEDLGGPGQVRVLLTLRPLALILPSIWLATRSRP